MKKFLFATAIASFFYSSIVIAASTTNQTPSDDDRYAAMQRQIDMLSKELKNLKKSNNSNTDDTTDDFATYSSKVARTNNITFDTKSASVLSSDEIANFSSSNLDGDITSIGGIIDSHGGIDIGNAAPITTQGQITYIGGYSGNNTIPIAQISSNLFASTLMGQRAKFDDYSVFFGGFIEADAQAWLGTRITNADKTIRANGGQNIYLTNAKLYFLSNLGHYVTAQFDFDTDETNGFKLGNAFAIFGNMDISPFFMTVGRNKLSVGAFGGGGPWTPGVTKALFSPGSVTNVSVNYKDATSNFNIAVFGANNENASFSTAYFYAAPINDSTSLGFNVGYIFDAKGANKNFATITALNRVGMINADANLSFTNILPGIWQVGAGWGQTTNKSSQYSGISNNYAGAFTIQTSYGDVIAGRKTNFNFSYGSSYNANKIPMALSSPAIGPKAAAGISNQFIASAQRAYFDSNVLFGPEYSYQKLYDNQHMNTFTLDMVVYV
ncbi:DUF3573 domain-containing protein [Francisella sp. XLW-1]|uniref:DUF3573 domain-containing protein n=1 Tax=Francisella sp. XLW-1 TaxID=2610887 RepID=UPI00123CC6B9|nr:DUF3573 domain-containing protein [Francisella sp. XLW-1]